MKLRNKKTGEVVVEVNKIGLVWNKYGMPAEIGQYDSIAELCEEWEDYVPREPLIKDEKIRKAVRAWAEANNINSRHYHENDVKFNSLEHELTWIDTSIQFNEFGALEGLEDGKRYTITELCGEEEAPEPIEPTFVDLDERIKDKEKE